MVLAGMGEEWKCCLREEGRDNFPRDSIGGAYESGVSLEKKFDWLLMWLLEWLFFKNENENSKKTAIHSTARRKSYS